MHRSLTLAAPFATGRHMRHHPIPMPPKHLLPALLILLLPLTARAQSLQFRNTFTLSTPDPSDLSALTWIGGDRWRALSDKANAAPCLTLTIDPATGRLTAVTITAPGDRLGRPRLDTEGIAFVSARHSYFAAEETTPALHEYSADTLAHLTAYPPPRGFARHARPNRGLESLAFAADRLYTANEEALTIDGPVATPNHGTRVRLVEYALTGQTPGAGLREVRQYIYPVDPPQRANAGPFNRPAPSEESGLSDIAALPDGRLLMLERSVYYTPFLGRPWPNFEARIYLVDPADATPLPDPTRSINDPANRAARPLQKTLLYRGAQFNMEGLALGPPTAHGLSILGITDNQKSATRGLINNQLHAFEWLPESK